LTRITGLLRYRRFARNSFARLLSYRANVLLYIFGTILQTVVLFYLWRAVFRSSGLATLRGFSFAEMILYLVATTAVTAIVRVNAGEVVATEIIEGSIAINLARPLDYRSRVFADSLGAAAYQAAFVGIPSFILVMIIAAGPGAPARGFELAGFPAFACSLLIAFALSFLYSFCLGLVAFVTTNMWGVSRIEMVAAVLLSGGLVPLAFFPPWLAGLAGYLPWASMGYTPVMVLLGKLEGAALLRALAVQALWAVFFWWFSGLAWNRLARRLAVNGG
jgi:ABC-2 type transport system permease protein